MKRVGILIRPENTEIENALYFDLARKNKLKIVLLNDEEPEEEFLQKCATCDGFILTGGNKKGLKDDIMIAYSLEKKLPLLGICQGMQSMAIYGSDDNTLKIGDDSHHIASTKRHLVYLKEGRVKSILGQDRLEVNSFHYETVNSSHFFTITGYSEDGLIEVIENPNHPFQIGLQWHPERMLDDPFNQKLINEFIKTVKTLL